MTLLCVPIFVNDIAHAKRDMALAAEAGADIVELRIDGFDGDISELLAHAVVPVIVTCRAPWEGGRSEETDSARIRKLAAADRAAYVDVELQTLTRTAISREHFPQRLVVSSHDFQGRPEKLHNLLVDLNAAPADVNKIVWTARTLRDNLEAFEILQSRTRPTVALCMGEAGLISRVLAKKFGAFLTFAPLSKDSSTASGQIPIADMKKLYRWDSINDKTRVYGVVAQPVMHSMSPAIHNAAFTATGHNGVYLPLLVDASYESFKAFMESFLHHPGMDLSGLSITIPHKENALRYLQEKNADIEPLAATIGAVNTILITRPEPQTANLEPSLRGINTDYAAILDSITTKLGITRDDLKNFRVAVLGAGGTGRTAVAALAHYGATVLVYNRTFDRAQALASEFNGRSGKIIAAPMEKLCKTCCQIILNTTSVGMYPKIDASPLGDNPPTLTPDTLVFDTIYNPLKTKLIQHAQSAGCKTIGGIEMFVRQAVAQFEAWTNLKAPADLMRQVIEQRLTP